VTAKTPCDLNGCCRNATADIEHSLTWLQARQREHLTSGTAAAWVDDPLPNDSHESIWVEPVDVSVGGVVGIHLQHSGNVDRGGGDADLAWGRLRIALKLRRAEERLIP